MAGGTYRNHKRRKRQLFYFGRQILEYFRAERLRTAGFIGGLVFIALLAIYLLPGISRAVSIGPSNPTAGVNDTGIGSVAWTTPGNVFTSNDTRATVSLSGNNPQSNYIKATGFGLSVPTNSTINGVVAEIERSEGSANGSNSCQDNAVRIVKGGTIGSTDRSAVGDWPAADAYASYGSSSDLWGETLTPADVNSANFGLAVSAKNIRSSGNPGTTESCRVDHIRITVHYTLLPSAFDQSAYRWFNNNNGASVGTALADTNTAATAPDQGTPFRLRMALHVSTTNLAQSGETFKLQFAKKGSGSCSSPEDAYADVTSSSAIRYYDNASASDGAALTTNANDPTHSGHTNRAQTYEESNPFSNSVAAISVGEDGLWDFALVDSSTPSSTAYCFRAIYSSGSTFSSYGVYPEITTHESAGAETGVDIVDASGNTVASPSFSMASHSLSFDCSPITGNFGTSSQRIRVTNGGIAENWNLTLAATGGSTATWSDGSHNYDFNDGSGSGCGDGGDSDSLPGQMSVNPSVGSISAKSGCTNTGITKGSSSSFAEGTSDNLTLLSADTSAGINCYWDFTGLDISQKIPAEQPVGTYTINLTLTLTAF